MGSRPARLAPIKYLSITNSSRAYNRATLLFSLFSRIRIDFDYFVQYNRLRTCFVVCRYL
ncbi:Bgt-20558 [Blumeria graminis f. sp. tritici]|uniref:Bgt-20558 n=2 Tax=Blumeria graminis f. sp. tritici TaxID=62690 RepID=A0A381LEV7_BLUGR|nr:Bgt-20558 [Blumeria graminis f. sp. tritici]